MRPPAHGPAKDKYFNQQPANQWGPAGGEGEREGEAHGSGPALSRPRCDLVSWRSGHRSQDTRPGSWACMWSNFGAAWLSVSGGGACMHAVLPVLRQIWGKPSNVCVRVCYWITSMINKVAVCVKVVMDQPPLPLTQFIYICLLTDTVHSILQSAAWRC